MELTREAIMAFIMGLCLSSLTGLVAIFWYRLRFYLGQTQRQLMLAFLTDGLGDPQKRMLYGKIRQKPTKSLMMESFSICSFKVIRNCLLSIAMSRFSKCLN